MSEEAKMYACSWCGKPTPNYREYLHPMAGMTADAYIEDIKYCPFCGEEL